MNPRPSLSPKHGKMTIRVTAVAFDLCVLYYRSPCIYPIVPSRVKYREKRVTASLIVFLVSGVERDLAREKRGEERICECGEGAGGWGGGGGGERGGGYVELYIETQMMIDVLTARKKNRN
jgi:hypothetical protein